MPEDIQSRFTVLETPSVHPGHCIVCGAVDRPVVDFGVEVDFEVQGYGRALFCVTCVKQAASKFPDDPNPNVVDRAFHEQALAEQKRSFYDGLHRYLDSFASDGSLGPEFEESEGTHEADDSYAGDNEDPEPAERGSDQSPDSDDRFEGPISVPGHSGNDVGFKLG